MNMTTAKSNADQWNDMYSRWLDDCLKEFNKRYNTSRKFHNDSVSDSSNVNPDEFVEFSEDGNAYPHSKSGTGYIKNAVTPWKNSRHFVK